MRCILLMLSSPLMSSTDCGKFVQRFAKAISTFQKVAEGKFEAKNPTLIKLTLFFNRLN